MARKINSARAWGYLYRNTKRPTGETCFSKPYGWKFPVKRVRVMLESDYRKLVKAGNKGN